MPNRPIQHEIADQALVAVEAVFAECGFATQRVYPDYGEDLVVQTTLRGRVDPNRIWVQVKGTQDWDKYRTDGGFRIRVKADTALKWARSADLVVAVLWDIGRSEGVWALPAEQVDDWDFVFDPPKTLSILLPDGEPFDGDCVRDLAWDARYDHYSNLLVQARVRDEFMANAHPDEWDSTRSLSPLVGFDFLRLIGLFQEGDEPATPELFERFWKTVANVREEKGTSEQEARRTAATLMLMEQAQVASGGRGTPGILIELAGDLAQSLLEMEPEQLTLDLDSGPEAF